MEGQKNKPVLEVEDLCISFEMYGKGLEKYRLEMVHHLSLTVNPGEIVAAPVGPAKACWPMPFWEYCREMQRWKEGLPSVGSAWTAPPSRSCGGGTLHLSLSRWSI